MSLIDSLFGNWANQDRKPAPGQGVDAGLAAALAPFLSGGSVAGGAGGVDIQGLLEQTLASSTGAVGTRFQTADPYHFRPNFVPSWVKNTKGPAHTQLMQALKAGQLDPFVPNAIPLTWQVYVGENPGTPGGIRVPGADGAPNSAVTKKTPTTDTTEIAQAVINHPYTEWSAEEIEANIAKFQEAGWDITDFDGLVGAWTQVVNRAAAMYSLSHGKKKVTPWDVLDMYKSESGVFGSGAGGSGGPITGKRTNVQRTVSEISEGDAWSVLRRSLSNMLGRDPEDDEIRDFTYRMNSLAARNPSISKTITDYGDGSGNTTSNTTSKTGFSAGDIEKAAYEDAQDDPGYAEFQSATTYFQAAQAALGAIGG